MMIRKAFVLIKEKLLFKNAFPPITDRTAWNQKALMDACTYNVGITAKGSKQNYITLRARVNGNTFYSNQIGSILVRGYTCMN